MTNTTNTSRALLLAGAALATVLSIPAQAETAKEATEASPDIASTAPAASTAHAQASAAIQPIEERQSYAVRLMTQIYDGARDVSHTQMLGIGRARIGNNSITQFDFGDGSVVVTPDAGKLAASRFHNITGSERVVLYNYDDKTVDGNSETARLHNRVIRPLLGKGPALGQNAQWEQSVPIGNLDVRGLASGDVKIELSRTYFTHDGLPMVLIEYAIPAFGYDYGSGRTVVQWGRGIALTDPGFGMIYLNAALHRAVETINGQPGRPYRYGRAMIAANPDGSAMVDYRNVKQLEGLIEPIMGADAMLVVPVSTPGAEPDWQALELARRLDLLALSIGEDGANEVPIGASVQTGDGRGAEVSPQVVQGIRSQLARELGVEIDQVPASLVSDVLNQVGARAMTMDGDIFLGGAVSPGDNTLYADEPVTVGNSSTGNVAGSPEAEAAAARAVASMIISSSNTSGGSGNSSGGFTIPDGTINTLNNSAAQGGDPVGDAFKRVEGGGDPYALFGNGGGSSSPSLQDKAATASTLASYGITTATLVSMADTGTVPPVVARRIEGNLADFQQKSEDLTKAINAKAAELNEARRQIANQRVEWTPNDELLRLEAAEEAASKGLAAAKEDFAKALANRTDVLEQTSRMTDVAQKEALREAASRQLANAIQDVEIAGSTLESASSARTAANADEAFWIAKGSRAELLEDGKRLSEELFALETQLARHGDNAQELIEVLDTLPTTAKAQFLKGLGAVANVAGHALNGYTIGASTANAYRQYAGDRGVGNVQLSREYGAKNVNFYLGIGFDFLGLGLSVVSGDVPGALSTAGAIATSNVSDIFVAFVGMNRAQEQASAAFNALQETRRRRSAQLLAKYGDPAVNMAQIEADLEIARAELGTLSQDLDDAAAERQRISRERLEERRRNRERAAREREEREREEAKRNSGGSSDEPYDGGLPTNWGGPDYPTAPPRVPKNDEPEEYTGPTTSELPPEILAEIEREQRRQQAQEELDAYQAEQLAKRREEEENNPASNGGSDVTLSPLEISEIVVSQFDIEPVTFDPPEWKPPEWKPPVWTPPEWVPPEFDPPEISQFPPTDPDDTDGYPGTGQYPAFGFDNLSGTVNTDLSKWEEWLKTQDIRKLVQLAISAGYPFAPGTDGLATLAIALADAENIIRLSQDSGYRRWSLQAPSCGGIVGCGPSYLERWSQKRSIVALGDILAQSRGVFSTGGFSDIGISGFNLAYILRDFGIEDGDLIDVEIIQFGRVIDRIDGHFLRVAGTPFGTRLRQGVAQLVITALNEGSASPNTAEVTLEDVVRGDSVQTFSLMTGQTATLRIEANASASGNANSGTTASDGSQGTTSVAPSQAPAISSGVGTQSGQAVPPSPARPEPGPRPSIRPSRIPPRMGGVRPQ